MSRRILVVDDSATVRGIVKIYIESHTTYQVCAEAADGLEAIAKARQFLPDLIVMDLAMPQMNGVEAAYALRDECPDIPVILFTIYKNVLPEGDVHLAGIRAVIPKDNPIMLVDQINTILH